VGHHGGAQHHADQPRHLAGPGIKAAATEGVRPGGERLRPPMAYGYYKNINRDDLDSIVAYLRRLKAK
jgi:hypothetical protein